MYLHGNTEIHVPQEMTVLSNGRMVGRQNEPRGMKSVQPAENYSQTDMQTHQKSPGKEPEAKRLRFLLFGGVDADAFCRLELHFAVDEGEEGEIASPVHVEARAELRSTLTDDDRSGFGRLACIELDPQHFRLAVASVSA